MMSWVHEKTTAFGLLLMFMESQKHGGKSSQMLPVMVVFRTECVKGQQGELRLLTDDSLSMYVYKDVCGGVHRCERWSW